MVALITLAASMVFFPQQAYSSALLGLNLWWEVVTPALLPYFFISELLLELDISRFLGKAMSPLMRPLFALPGSASLAVALGFCSGFPSGAAISASLRRRGEISREEGSRLVCFTNNAGPLYISVAVAGGLLECPKAAVILAITQYGGNLLLGIILGLLARKKKVVPDMGACQIQPHHTSHNIDLGRTVKTAASRAAANITSIGCLMIFFSVLNGFFTAIPFNADPLASGAIQGFWEMSLGVNALADSGLQLTYIIPAVAAILGFGGISVQMQVLAMIGDTDISFWPYLICRLIHAVAAYFSARWLCTFISLPVSSVNPVINTGSILLCSLTAAAIALGILFVLSLLSLIFLPLLQRFDHRDHNN